MSGPPFREAHNRSVARQDPREIPLYDMTQAATFVGVSPAVLEEWMQPVTCGADRLRPLLQPADPRAGLLSFANLIDAHVLDVTRKHRIPMLDVRMAIDSVQGSDQSTPHPLLTGAFERHGKRRFVTSLSQTMRGLESVREWPHRLVDFTADLDRYLGRIDRDDNADPYQLFPMRRNENKRVVLNINLLAGQPVLAGTGFRVHHLMELAYRGRMSMGEIAARYDIEREAVVEAIDFIAA